MAKVPIADMQEERSRAHETLRTIDHLCGPGRAENKERYRKYFERCDENGDGVLEYAEVKCALHAIFKDLSMDPPSAEKLEALFARCDKNGDGVPSLDEWSRFYTFIIQGALAHAQRTIDRVTSQIEREITRGQRRAIEAQRVGRKEQKVREGKAARRAYDREGDPETREKEMERAKEMAREREKQQRMARERFEAELKPPEWYKIRGIPYGSQVSPDGLVILPNGGVWN